MSTRCPACGEFIGDNTFGKSPLHKCGAVINWNAVELASTDPRDAEIAALKADLARAVELLREIGKWERMFDDPDARMVVTKIDAFLAERGGEV